MPTVPMNPPSVPPGPIAAEGVAAMIPVANITLEDALLDNPNFRANITLFEGQVFFIESWLVALQRSMNQFTEEWKRLNEVTSVLNKRAEVPLLSQGMLSSQYTIPAMKLVGGAFRTTLALKNNYITEVNEKVLKPLDEFLKTDLKDFKESKKTFDKALEKYESTLAKYNGQSRQKEPSALREEAFQLYDTRKAYIQAAMACSMLCIRFQDGLDQLVLGVFLDLIATQHDYFSGNSDHFGSMALQVLQLKTYMKDHKEASAIAISELEQNKERYTADAVEYWKPSRSLKCYSSTPVGNGKSTIGLAALGPAFAAQVAGQVPMTNLMSRPATMSQISTTATNRLPIPTQQFQSQPGLAPLLSTPPGIPKSTSMQSAPLEPVSDNLMVATTLPRNPSSSSLPTSALCVNSNSSSMNSIYQAERIDEFTPTTKQGYLNIRIPQPKNRAPVWQRKYFFIQEGEFGFESVVSNPALGSQVVQSERIAVILCELRYGSSSNSLLALSGNGNPASGSQGLAMVQMERRFCFEVVCATQSYLLQAETEDDLMSWVNTFEAAKRDVFLQQNFPQRPEPEEPYSPMVPDNSSPSFSFSGEDLLPSKQGDDSNSTETSKPSGSLGLGWAASVPGVSLLLGSYAGNSTTSATTSDPSVATNEAGENELNSSTYPPNQDSESQSTLPADSAPPTSTQQSRDGSSPPPSLDTATLTHSRSIPTIENASEPTTEHTRQQSEIEKLMTSSLHLVPKATPLATTDIPHYPMELVVRNRELHLRFHGTKVHFKEYVLHSWTSGYLDDSRPDKPIMVYGRVFLTQSGMYFYSRDLSVETKRMYRFSTIRGIECEQKDISTEWRIETMDGVQHVFCQFTLMDTEYQVLHLIWTNVHQAKERLPVKELFRQTMQITSKPKGSAGSGSLAETESSHQTTGDSTMISPSDHGKDVVGSPHEVASAAAAVKTIDEGWQDLDEGLPAAAETPPGPVACNCPGHLEKLELEQNFNVSAKTLDRLLFSNDSPVWKEFHTRRNNTIQSIGEWTSSGDKKTRVVKFLMVVNNPLVKLNQTDCVETHTCEVEEEHLRYSYTVKSSVLAMPYSDAFTPILRYCITYVGKKECKLTCSSGIEWHKNPLVKAMIKGAILKGTAETVRDVTEILQAHLEDRKDQNGHAPGAGSTNGAVRPIHLRSESSKIVISLNAPDDKAHSILLDPQDGANGPDFADKTKGNRAPGARRHTVSTGAGSGGIVYSGHRVHGHWPTGAQPSFVPVGTKASRTRLLGRPSRLALSDQARADTSGKGRSSRHDMFSTAWLKKNVFGILSGKDEQERTLLSTRLLYIVLVVSSLINIWAALNSQRMLNSAWKLKEQGILSSGGPLRGYPEPLHRVSFGESHHHENHDHSYRNVRVAARAVFLRDLEEQMLSGELDSFDDGRTIDPKSFKIFLEIRDSFRPWPQRPLEWFTSAKDDGLSSNSLSPPTASSTSLSPSPSASPFSDPRKPLTVPQYPWLLPQHRRWATRIIFQRDRVGILRHDLLLTFEVLKQLEQRLLETEYVNWIMDERSRCRLWERRRADEQKKRSGALPGTSNDDDKDSNDREKGDELKRELLRQLETDQGVNIEKVKEELLKHLQPGYDPERHDDDQEDGDTESLREQLAKAKVTREFCQGLEHQVNLFMLDTKQNSSS
ncbi:SNF1-interacting protein [Podila minutissima]|uniref:SNF1-interacting protein n=1 Tax=Podila minutissima TaxID=64525 RepID=A0A9P5SD20_9FUNG|nr:SNF1-interacting protein [Podila minutissima]